MSDGAARERNRKVVEQFFAANLANPEERLQLWADDGVKEFAWPPPNMGQSRWVGKDELTANAIHLSRMLKDFAHVNVEVHGTDDPELFFITSEAAETSLKDGQPFPMRYLHLLRVHNGKVTYHREYFDSYRMQQVLAAT